MTTIHQFLSWLKERSKKNKSDEFDHQFSSNFSQNDENAYLANVPGKLPPMNEDEYFCEQMNEALSVRATMKLPPIPREAMRLRKFVRYPRQTDSPHIYEEIAYEAMDKVQQTLAMIDEQERNQADEMINVQNLDFTKAKEVGPYLVVPMKNKISSCSTDSKNVQSSQKYAIDVASHNDSFNHPLEYHPHCQSSSHTQCQMLSHNQLNCSQSTDDHHNDMFLCCHAKHQNTFCNSHSCMDHISQRRTCHSCSNLLSIVSTPQQCVHGSNCLNVTNECNSVHTTTNKTVPHFKSILNRHNTLSDKYIPHHVDASVHSHQFNSQQVFDGQLQKTVSFCDSVKEYPISEDALSFNEKEFDALHDRDCNNGILVLKCDKHKRNDSLMSILTPKPLSESDSGNSSTYAYSGSDREQSLNSNCTENIKIPESDSSNDTYSEYDIRSSDESPYTEYDYFLSKAKHNLWLKQDVMRVIRESESSDYEGVVMSENESGSFTTVTSLSSDKSLFSEEDLLHEVLLRKLQKKRDKNQNHKKSCRATKDMRSSKSTENLEAALKIEQKLLNNEKNFKYACSKCNRIHSKREHCKSSKKKQKPEKSHKQEYYSLPDFVVAFDKNCSHQVLSEKSFDEMTQLFSNSVCLNDDLSMSDSYPSDMTNSSEISNFDKLSCRATDYQPLSPMIKNIPNIYERVEDDDLKNSTVSSTNGASSLFSSLASSVYDYTQVDHVSSTKSPSAKSDSVPNFQKEEYSRMESSSSSSSTVSNYKNDSCVPSRRNGNRLLSDIMKMNHDRQILFY